MPLLGSQPLRTAAPALDQAPTPKAALAGTITILVVLALRVLVACDPTPGWGGDPLEMESPIVSLTPMGSLIVDALTFAGAALILVSMSRRAQAPPLWQTLCLAAGAVAIALHARVLRDASMENLILGSSWLAAFTAAFAMAQAARDARLRSLTVAALLGLIAPLVIKGVVQYVIEQPESVKMFLESKARILAANGWNEDSPMARAYWERLRQREATAWFGLANVFATLAAASLVALTGLTIAALRDRATPARPQTLAFLTFGLGAAAAGVVLAGAKGGYTAAALGLALIALIHLWPRLSARPPLLAPKEPRQVATGGAGPPPAEPVESAPRNPAAPAGAKAPNDFGRHSRHTSSRSHLPGSLLALSLPALALLAITARGLLSERLHELSLLFRWVYIQTAAKIFAQHPLLGAGPDGFKEAYMLLKPAISPEDVSSPHSISFDLAARLGLGGLALSALLIAWLWRTGRATDFGVCEPSTSAPPTPQESPDRTDARLLLITISIATAAAALIEQQTATVTSTLARAGGLAGFLLIAIATLRLFRTQAAARFAIPAIAAAAIAAFTHCQIELTGITPGANMWVFLLLAVGAGAGATARLRAVPEPTSTLRLRTLLALAIPITSLALLVPFALIPTARWDLFLRYAYQRVEDIPSLSVRADAIAQRKPLPRDSAKALATDLSAAIGMRVDESQVGPALALLRYKRSADALDTLRQAATIRPPDSETHRAAARLLLQLAAMDLSRAHTADATAGAAAAEKLAEDFNETTGPSPSQLAWLGLIRRSRYELDHDRAHLTRAVDAWEKAAALAPHEPNYAVQLARAYNTLGDADKAGVWAQTALAINQDLHLDPLRQFSPADLEELGKLARHRPPVIRDPQGP
jgi:hypothetical protein